MLEKLRINNEWVYHSSKWCKGIKNISDILYITHDAIRDDTSQITVNYNKGNPIIYRRSNLEKTWVECNRTRIIEEILNRLKRWNSLIISKEECYFFENSVDLLCELFPDAEIAHKDEFNLHLGCEIKVERDRMYRNCSQIKIIPMEHNKYGNLYPGNTNFLFARTEINIT